MDLQWVEFVEQTLGRVEHINQTFEHMLERPPSVLSECASRTHFQQTNPMAEFKTLIAKYLVCPDKQLAIKFMHIYMQHHSDRSDCRVFTISFLQSSCKEMSPAPCSGNSVQGHQAACP